VAGVKRVKHRPAPRASKITRRDLLSAGVALPLVYATACSGDDAQQPASAQGKSSEPKLPPRKPKHLLVLVADDQSRCNVGAYGNHDVHSPNVDKIAAQGMRFERAYATVGVCKPSRSSLYTGLYPHKNGATGFKAVNDDAATWPELLTPEACATGMLGKLNVKPIKKFKFEKWARPKQLGDARQSEPFTIALREMYAQFADRRTAIIINFRDPHRPFREPLASDGEGSPLPHDPAKCALPPSLYDTPETHVELAEYYDLIWRLDRTIGGLLAVLDERGIANDTLVIYTSDNGMPFPFAKTTLYEAGLNLPLIARWPGVIEGGSVNNALVSLLDLLPTALDIFDVASERAFDGHSLLPLFRGETKTVHDFVIGEHTEHLVGKPTPSRSIRDERYKFIRNFAPDAEFENNVLDHSATWKSWIRAAHTDAALAKRMRGLIQRAPEELFDLQSDPWELSNLAGDEQHAEVLAAMRARLHDWMRDEKDPLYDG